jgi:imidazole glycerol-phosphate synthase subunit HisH
MPDHRRAVIVDYGMGNLYSVHRACEHVGLEAAITASPAEVREADAVILPGVGSMPVAMATLDESGLGDALRAVAERGTPLMGVCLGMQLLMEEGSEFTTHRGLGILPGKVVRFPARDENGAQLKVPHIGWNRVHRPSGYSRDPWLETPLQATPEGEYMYFVHSYLVVPREPNLCVGVSRYGGIEFCSVVARGSVFGCQFHPERSGPQGLQVYREFARRVSAYQPGLSG